MVKYSLEYFKVYIYVYVYVYVGKNKIIYLILI